MKKYLILLLLVLSIVGCSGGDDSTATSTVDTTNTTTSNTSQDDIPDFTFSEANTRHVYYKNDFSNDTSLSVVGDNVALYEVDNNTALDEVIPFVVDTENDYEFCTDGAQNILKIEIFNDANISIFIDTPKFALNCRTIRLAPQKYKLKLSYANKISSKYGVEVPYIRLFEKIEIESEVSDTDWDSGKIYESTLPRIYTQEPYFTDYRHCYKTPINTSSYISFWREQNKLTLSFRANLIDGTFFRCTYPGTAIFNPLNPSNASDIGDIDSVVRNLLDDEDEPSLVYSRPASGSTLIDLDTSVNIKFRGSIDRLSLDDAFSISPSIDGVLSLNGQILTFTPNNKLDLITKYRVELKGLSDNGVVIPNIDFLFTTHDSYAYDSSKSLLSNYELCAVGVSSYCTSDGFSTINNINIDFLNNHVNGSRILEIESILDKTTPANILIDYELVGSDSPNKLLSGSLLLENGTIHSSSEISFRISLFIMNEQNATLTFTKINNAHLNSNDSFEYIISSGEFFKSHTEVIAPEIVEINNMYFTYVNPKNRILTIGLDAIAVEDVDVNIYFNGTNKKIKSCKEYPTESETSSCTNNLYEPGWQITTIKKGTSSIDMNITFSTNEDAYIYSEDFEATVYAVRNASVEAGLSADVTFDVR